MGVLPVELFLQQVSGLNHHNYCVISCRKDYRYSYSFTEANDRPHGAAEGAATTQTPAEQPPDIHRKSFS